MASASKINLKTRSEQGFSLIELLVTISILGVLAGTSIQTFATYRAKAYQSSVGVMIRNVRTALEQSKGETYASYSAGGVSLLTTGAGNFSGWRWGGPGGGAVVTGAQVVPGIKADKNLPISLSLNFWCNDGAIEDWGGDPSQASCITDWIQAYHCKGEQVEVRAVWNNGEIMDMSWQSPGC